MLTVNYVHWNIVSGLLKYTTETLRDAIFELVREEYGAKSRPPRYEFLRSIKFLFTYNTGE